MGFLWLLCFKYLCLYNNDAKIFGAEGVLCRRFENLENKMAYTTRGKCSIYRDSSVSVFFLKKVSSREDCAEGFVWDCVSEFIVS